MSRELNSGSWFLSVVSSRFTKIIIIDHLLLLIRTENFLVLLFILLVHSLELIIGEFLIMSTILYSISSYVT